MSIISEQNHFATSGSSLHDIVGPISVPSVGPTLPTQLRVMVMALVLSMPMAIMVKEITRQMMRYVVRKASSVTRFCIGTFTPSIFSGSTALGCRIWRNSFFTILTSITPRMHFKPPLVLPEQAPKNMQAANITQVT